VAARTQPPLSKDEQAQERRLEEEGEQAFHRERLADDAAREVREPGPVGAELELQRDPRHHTDREVEPEDADPESRGLVMALGSRAQPAPLQPEDEQGEAHRELRE
jgi:hypothetical protein